MGQLGKEQRSLAKRNGAGKETKVGQKRKASEKDAPLATLSKLSKRIDKIQKQIARGVFTNAPKLPDLEKKLEKKTKAAEDLAQKKHVVAKEENKDTKVSKEENVAKYKNKTVKKLKRDIPPPPDGYVCKFCKIPGHWVRDCGKKYAKRSKKCNAPANPNHIYVMGVDPSQKDIENAKKMQAITPPNCWCDIPSRLKKVKAKPWDKSGTEESRAAGKYFFFCSKKKHDETACRFAKAVGDELAKGTAIKKRAEKRLLKAEKSAEMDGAEEESEQEEEPQDPRSTSPPL